MDPSKPEPTLSPVVSVVEDTTSIREAMNEVDKITSALPKVDGLGEYSDIELDHIATKAETAYNDIMDLGMNVEPRYSARLFEVAGGMLKTALDAKTSKIDKKLKMIDLQLKKLAIDKKNGDTDEISSEGFVVMDRNSLIEKIRNMQSPPKE
jgi:copper chaperone CopZ